MEEIDRPLITSGRLIRKDGRTIITIEFSDEPPPPDPDPEVPPVLFSVAISPSTVIGPAPATGTLTLTAPALAGGYTVNLNSSNIAAAYPPSTVVIPEGDISATFPVTTLEGTTSRSVTITAYNGDTTKTDVITVAAAAAVPTLTALSLSPTSVTGPASATGTATLTGAAPTGGLTVTLSSNAPTVATVPASVLIPAGSVSASFTVTALSQATAHSATISATLAGVTRTAALSVAAPSTTGKRMYWGAWVQSVPYQTTLWDAYEQRSGKPQSITHWGQPWKQGGVYQSFPTTLMQKARARGEIPMLDWASWNLGSGLTQPDFQLADIIAGTHNAYIDQWATAAKAWGKPFFLRLNHEMNGWWFPWSEQVNGNSAGQYVLAWRHIHNRFTAIGANNVTWNWCMNMTGSNGVRGTQLTPYASMYPGSAYVDWLGFDAYNWGTHRGSWQTFSQIMNPSYADLVALDSTKPILMAEWGCTEAGGSKSAWLTDALTRARTDYPKLGAVVYFNVAGTSDDWPVESSTTAQAAWKAGIAHSGYAANSFGAIEGKIAQL
jgi:hypothetical protein